MHTIMCGPDIIRPYGGSFSGELILSTDSSQERNCRLEEKFQIPEIMQKLHSCILLYGEMKFKNRCTL